MDTTNLVLLVLIFASFSWWFIIRLSENKRFLREAELEERDRLKRMERVKKLTNRR